jgi:hypothetical protein
MKPNILVMNIVINPENGKFVLHSMAGFRKGLKIE